MIEYIDAYRDRFGVEAICRTLKETECRFITSRGYRAAKTRAPSARSLSDALLIPELVRVYEDNFSVYGAARCGRLCSAPAGTSVVIRPRV